MFGAAATYVWAGRARLRFARGGPEAGPPDGMGAGLAAYFPPNH